MEASPVLSTEGAGWRRRDVTLWPQVVLKGAMTERWVWILGSGGEGWAAPSEQHGPGLAGALDPAIAIHPSTPSVRAL